MNFDKHTISAEIIIAGDNSDRVFDVNGFNYSKEEMEENKGIPQLYIDCEIENVGMGAGKAYISIYGLSEETMAACTIVHPQSAVRYGNRISVKADGVQIVNGEIFTSVPNYSKAPNLSLDIECWLDYNGVQNKSRAIEELEYPSYDSSDPENYRKKTIHDGLKFIAMQLCGYNQGRDVFEEERASGKNYSMDGKSCLYLRTCEPLPYRLYLVGTPKQILDDYCKNFGIGYILKTENKKTELWYYPAGRFIGTAVGNSNRGWQISAEQSNLFGYPTATNNGCKFKCEFLSFPK